MGCEVLNDMVYVVGGMDGINLKMVERYDLEFNMWMMVVFMSIVRFVLLFLELFSKILLISSI